MNRPEVFESIDRLVGVEIRPGGLPVGVMPKLYAVARDSGPPLSLKIAERLLMPAIERVAIVTGVVFETLPRGEIDGPIGSAILANALTVLGRRVAVVVPAEMTPVVAAVKGRIGSSFEVVRDQDADASDFDAAVAVERLGRNRQGQHHSIFGAPLDLDPVADEFFETLNRDGKLTVGIGDGGNEIGFGALYNEAREAAPRGDDCGCPCGGGIVTGTATELVYPVAVSDFGAYALAASVGLLENRPTLAPEPALVASAIKAALDEGCLDGGTFQPGFVGDDGIPIETIEAVVGVLRGIAAQSFRESPRHA